MITRSADVLIDNFTESLAFARLCLLVQLKSQHHQADVLRLFVIRQRPLVEATQHPSLRDFYILGADIVGRVVMAHAPEALLQLCLDGVLGNEDGWDGRGCVIEKKRGKCQQMQTGCCQSTMSQLLELTRARYLSGPGKSCIASKNGARNCVRARREQGSRLE